MPKHILLQCESYPFEKQNSIFYKVVLCVIHAVLAIRDLPSAMFFL